MFRGFAACTGCRGEIVLITDGVTAFADTTALDKIKGELVVLAVSASSHPDDNIVSVECGRCNKETEFDLGTNWVRGNMNGYATRDLLEVNVRI